MNINYTKLYPCGFNPITGYNRNGYCELDDLDHGSHLVCAKVTKQFLNFSKQRGNDLITQRGNFPGLKSGDRWCLCVYRWLEAYEAGVAPLTNNIVSLK